MIHALGVGAIRMDISWGDIEKPESLVPNY